MSKFIELHRNGNLMLVNVDRIVAVDRMPDGVDIMIPTPHNCLEWVSFAEPYEDVKKMLGVGE